MPRPGDSQGSLDTEKAWLRSWIDETYLWYQDVRGLPPATLDPANSATPLEYFDKLKSPATTASGKDKDEFHFTYPTPEWIALSQSGIAYGYGFQVALLDDTAPDRVAVVAYVEPGSPAAAAGITRGTAIVAVDGADVADGAAATVNAGLFPEAAGDHTLRRPRCRREHRPHGDADGAAARLHPGAEGGHAAGAEPERRLHPVQRPHRHLRGAARGGDQHAQGGGGDRPGARRALQRRRLPRHRRRAGLHDRRAGEHERQVLRAAELQQPRSVQPVALRADDRLPQRQPGLQRRPSGQTLPDLGLNRVFVLTSADTCSASESIVNGLRGAGVTVHLVGSTTCGKPYGFYPQDNCGTTYFAIQFQGVNFLGFGDYADGFAPTCTVADDFAHALGDPAENQLEVALGLRNTGACTAPTSMRAQALGIARRIDSGPVLKRTPERENRIYRQR